METGSAAKAESETRTKTVHQPAKAATVHLAIDTVVSAAPVSVVNESTPSELKNPNRVELNRIEKVREKIGATVRSSKKSPKKVSPKPRERGEGFVLVLKILLVAVMVVIVILLAMALLAAAHDPLALLLLIVLFVPIILGLALLMGIILSM